jgi:hypothetical protein
VNYIGPGSSYQLRLGAGPSVAHLTINELGNVGIGTTAINYKLAVAGQIGAWSYATNTNIDLAENFPSKEKINAGEIAIFNGGKQLSKATKSESGKIAGIVSTKPGIILGKKTGDTSLALAGRVPTKVNTENGTIKPGDMITASSTPGIGMKATEPGRVVGMALEGFSGSGTGKIIVFVNPHTWIPPVTLASLKQAAWNGGMVTNNTTFTASVRFEGAVVYAGNTAFTGPVKFTGGAEFDEILVKGHIKVRGETPKAISSNACQSEVTIEGSDTAGTVVIETSNACAAGKIAKINFAKEFETIPHMSLTPTNANAAAVQAFIGAKELNLFEIETKTGLEANQTYKFDYITID